LLLACLSSLVYCLRVRPELTHKHQNRLEWPNYEHTYITSVKKFKTSYLTLNYYIRLKRLASNKRPSLFEACISDDPNGFITLTLFEVKYILGGEIVKTCFCLSLISH